MASTWDETCPACRKKLDVYNAFCGSGDYQVEFKMECEHCQAKIRVDVSMVPEFECVLLPQEPKHKEAT